MTDIISKIPNPLLVGGTGVGTIELVQQVPLQDVGHTIGLITQLVIGFITVWKLIFPKKEKKETIQNNLKN